MEKKVYVVEKCWESEDDNPDNRYNCSTNEVERIFSTKELAMDYIRKRLIQEQDPYDDEVLCRVYNQEDNYWDWDWERYDYDDFKTLVMTRDDPETIEYHQYSGLNWFSINEYILDNQEVTNG